jgi:excisionase family DNA binding protein
MAANTTLLNRAGPGVPGAVSSTEASQMNEVFGVREAAKYLHCSPSHVSNILNGKIPNVPPIPHVRAGRLRLIRRESLVRWFSEQEAACRAPRSR